MKNSLLFLVFSLVICTTLWSQQRYVHNIFRSVDVSSIQFHQAIDYQGNVTDLYFDLYEPAGDTLAERITVAFVHGGGFTSQARDESHIIDFCTRMARKGFVVASFDYRLDSTVSHRAIHYAREDVNAGIRYLKANSISLGIDTNSMFSAGESAGAVLTLLSNHLDQPNELNYPPTLPLATNTTVAGGGNPGFSPITKGSICLCGGTETAFGHLFLDSAVIDVDHEGVGPSILFIHGTQDPLIPLNRALDIKTRADNIGLYNKFFPVWGGGHCPWHFSQPNYRRYMPYLVDVVAWWISTHFIWGITKKGGPDFPNFVEPITVYPNPSYGVFRIEGAAGIDKNAVINVYDLMGKLVYDAPFKVNNNQQAFDLSELESGIYNLMIYSEGEIHHNQKIVIQ